MNFNLFSKVTILGTLMILLSACSQPQPTPNTDTTKPNTSSNQASSSSQTTSSSQDLCEKLGKDNLKAKFGEIQFTGSVTAPEYKDEGVLECNFKGKGQMFISYKEFSTSDEAAETFSTTKKTQMDILKDDTITKFTFNEQEQVGDQAVSWYSINSSALLVQKGNKWVQFAANQFTTPQEDLVKMRQLASSLL